MAGGTGRGLRDRRARSLRAKLTRRRARHAGSGPLTATRSRGQHRSMAHDAAPVLVSPRHDRATARGWATALSLVLAGCAESHLAPPDLEAGEVEIAPDGTSGVVAFDVPAGVRSVTVVVEGSTRAIYALASFRLADGIEHVAPVDPSALRADYPAFSGAGADRQWPRPGTFVFQYPTLATQALPPGPASVRVASDVAGARARIRIYMPPAPGRTLHLSLVSFSSAMPLDVEPAIMDSLRATYAMAGVTVVVDEMIFAGERPSFPTPGTPSPDDAGAALVRSAQDLLSTNALPVIFIEHVADRVFGSTRGLPCPPEPESYYYGVIIDPTPESGGDDGIFLPRIIAHEVGHALGLPHPEDSTIDGEPVDDAFDDTTSFDDTIMGSALLGGPLPPLSLRISPQQAFALTRSALLE